MFVLIRARHRRRFFWPAYPLVGWGLGLSFQHFSAECVTVDTLQTPAIAEHAMTARGRAADFLDA